MRARDKLFLASSNPGKVREFRALAEAHASRAGLEIDLLPEFSSLPPYEEKEATIAENAAGKALYYSQPGAKRVFADDSGLIVPALGGAPGVHSARYAGVGASNAERISKLLREMQGKQTAERDAYFVCAVALAIGGRIVALVTDRVDGEILERPQGSGGFGYDSVFYFAALRKTFAEMPEKEKNQFSHRGKAFRKLLAAMDGM